MADPQAVSPLVFERIPGWWSTPEWYAERVTEAPPVAHFVEVGSWQGRSACSAAEAIRASGKLIRFDCVDTWKGTDPKADNGFHERLLADLNVPLREAFERNLRDAGVWRYVNPVAGRSVEVAERYADASLDGVMLDAEHTEAAVTVDLRAWLPKVRPGGWIGGHDAQNPGVLAALAAVLGGDYSVHRDCWVSYVPAAAEPPVERFFSPPDWGTGDRWRPWVVEGFHRLHAEVCLDGRLTGESHFLKGAHQGEPIHIAALEVDGRRVYYDFSDFRRAYPKVGSPYFKIQACEGDGTLPAGQGIGDCATYLDALPTLREAPRTGPALVAYFANSDKTGLRLDALLRLRKMARRTGADFRLGMARFNQLRPEVPQELDQRLPPLVHWKLQASAALALALPGVEGDWTWRHTEVLGMGRCLVTLETDQRLPGNWRGCWPEVRRDLGNLEDVVAGLLADPEERERLARLGRWYYESELAPERLALRLAGVGVE